MRFIKPMMVIAALIAMPGSAALADGAGAALFADKCASCHTTDGPPKTVDEAIVRKAPDLSFAGAKFKPQWLVGWLQQPTPLRRAGIRVSESVMSTANGDMVDEAKVPRCQSSLSQSDAEAVSAYLATLTGSGQTLMPIDETGKLRKSKAYRVFATKYACIACHQITFRGKPRGGLSGPDLREAGLRLKADWTATTINNPKAWLPVSPMPKYQLDDKDVRLLTLYLMNQRGAKK